MNKSPGSGFRTVRGYQLENQQEGGLTPVLEDYLEMVHRICADGHANFSHTGYRCYFYRGAFVSGYAALITRKGNIERTFAFVTDTAAVICNECSCVSHFS